MKRWRSFFVISGLVLAIVGLLAVSGGVWAAPPDNPGPPLLEKMVFVHYPKTHLAKPPWAGGGNGGGQEACPFKVSSDEWVSSLLPVEYWVNLSGSGCTEGGGETSCQSFLAGIQDGFQVWEDVLHPADHVDYLGRNDDLSISSLLAYDDDPTNDDLATDGENVVGWEYISDIWPNAIAVTIYWRYPWGDVVEADMAFNTAYEWRQYTVTGDPNVVGTVPGATAMDVQNITAHEAGHFVGPLGDLYDSTAIEQTMYGYSSQGEVNKRSLECGDTKGIEKLYSSGGKGGGKKK